MQTTPSEDQANQLIVKLSQNNEEVCFCLAGHMFNCDVWLSMLNHNKILKKKYLVLSKMNIEIKW